MNTIGPLSSGRISCIFIHVTDVQRMLAFYRDILGFSVFYADGDLCAFVNLPNGNDCQIALYSGRKSLANAENHWFTIIDVVDLDKVVSELQQRGVAVGPIEPVPYGRAAQFNDPEGNLIEIHEPANTNAVDESPNV